MEKLKIKSDQNIDLAEHCLNQSKYLDASASRIYYSIFQRMKYLLLKNEFNYKEFLTKKNFDKREKDYSHGTISIAIDDLFDGNFDSKLKRDIDLIYKIRKLADYKTDIINKSTFTSLFQKAKDILQYLDKFDN